LVNPATTQDALNGLQPTAHFEDVETKRRFHNLLHVSGLVDSLVQLRARPAAVDELCLVHTPGYVQSVQKLSQDSTKGCHHLGNEVSMAPGGYEIAALAAGGSIVLTDAALDGTITNGYALTRCVLYLFLGRATGCDAAHFARWYSTRRDLCLPPSRPACLPVRLAHAGPPGTTPNLTEAWASVSSTTLLSRQSTHSRSVA
jgi:hypothetical protein